MKSILLAALCFLLFSPGLLSQDLVHWQDVLSAEITRTPERIQAGPDSLQFADLWLPDGEGPHPTVILIHGGCWLSTYPGVKLTNPIADALSNNGFAVWNIEYRRVGHNGGGYPGTFLDVAGAADHLREISGDFDLDLENLIAVGHSAGGHLATWLAARRNIPTDSELYRSDPIQITRVISLAGINDLEYYAWYGSAPCGEQTVEKLVSLEERGEDVAYTDTSPAQLLPLQAEHVEVAGSFDRPVPPFFGREFSLKAAESGGTSRFILQPNAGHYEMTAPWTDEWKQVMDIITYGDQSF